MSYEAQGQGWGRRVEFGLGATFKRPDGTEHNAANQMHEDFTRAGVEEYWKQQGKPVRPRNQATISKFSEDYARSLGYQSQRDMRGEDW